MFNEIPAGLLNNDIEFFAHPTENHRSDVIHNGNCFRVKEAPGHIKQLVDEDMARHPEKTAGLDILGFFDADGRREKYCRCCLGACNSIPDVIDGQIVHNEFWPCPDRGSCPAEGILCTKPTVGPAGAKLTRKEVEVLELIAKGLYDKEIAPKLKISAETLKVHKRHIMRKTGTNNKPELVLLALNKNFA
jgi:DNA-binding CsgD family transcriptional regulator